VAPVQLNLITPPEGNAEGVIDIDERFWLEGKNAKPWDRSLGCLGRAELGRRRASVAEGCHGPAGSSVGARGQVLFIVHGSIMGI